MCSVTCDENGLALSRQVLDGGKQDSGLPGVYAALPVMKIALPSAGRCWVEENKVTWCVCSVPCDENGLTLSRQVLGGGKQDTGLPGVCAALPVMKTALPSVGRYGEGREL